MGCCVCSASLPIQFKGVAPVHPLKTLVAERRWRAEDFILETTVGEGMFSRVRVAKIREDPEKQPLALKILRKRDIVKLQQVDHIRTEKEIMLMIRHPFIVDLLGTFQDEANLYLMMEYVNGGEVHEYIQNQGGSLPLETARFFSGEIFLAVAYLHSLSIAHRDLKPQNLLITAEGHVKLTDFGFAKIIKDGERSHTLVGTPEYVAPEIIRRTGHSLAVDWWAFGIVLFELLTAFTPFVGEDMESVFDKIQNSQVSFPANIDPKAKPLISRLLVQDEIKRLGAKGHLDIRKQLWFRGVDFDSMLSLTSHPPYKPPVRGKDDTVMFMRYNNVDIVPSSSLSPAEQELFRRFSSKSQGHSRVMKQRLYPEGLDSSMETQDVTFIH